MVLETFGLRQTRYVTEGKSVGGEASSGYGLRNIWVATNKICDQREKCREKCSVKLLLTLLTSEHVNIFVS